MYSTGTFHTAVPRERKRNLRFRSFVLRRCREDPRYRAAVVEMCRTDIVFWINTFVWQFNPNTIGKGSPLVGQFVTWEYQDDAIRTILEAISGRNDLVIEKSREMGASWLCLLVMLWFFLFHPLSVFMVISRNADMVDSPKSDSLFWKLDYVLKKLPDWMVPNLSRRQQSYVNEDNGSQLNGYATTEKSGIGGRATAIFIDEFALIDKGWALLEYTANTSGCRIFNSTHRGTNTAFFELTQKANQSRHLKKLVMHWTSHPDKGRGCYHWDAATQALVIDPTYPYPADYKFVTDGSPTGGPRPGVRSPWYDKVAEAMATARGVAADLDINPSGSQEQVFDAVMIGTLKALYCREPYEYDLAYDRLSADPARFYPAPGGKFRTWQRLPADGKPAPARYVFGADIATGTGATPSCLCGADAATGEKVFEYADSRIEPKEFAYLAVAVARLYKGPDGRPGRLAWEVPGPGNTFGKHVIALGHRDVYYRTTEHRLKKEVSDTPGWSNAPDSMKLLIEGYKDALRSKQFLNRSEFALSECLAFVYAEDGYVYHTGWKDPKDPSGARINHGDRVVADALCWKMVEESGRLIGPDAVPVEDPVVAGPRAGLAWRREMARMGGDQSNWDQ